jgi:hypothetical protein
MENQENIKSILKDCKLFQLSNLKIYFSAEINEKNLEPYYFSHYTEAYLLSNFRFFRLKYELDRITNMEPKNVEVFITTNKDLYKKILKDEGMSWVTEKDLEKGFGFVSGSINICYIDKDVLTKYLPPRSSELDSLCHEFTHLLLTQYLSMKWEEYDRYWNNIFEEGFAVLLNNQYKEIFNMKKDLEKNKKYNYNEISIRYLKENGFFKIDDRSITENFEYQYSASIVKKIDDSIRGNVEYSSEIPLRGIFSYLINKKDKGECIEDDLKKDFEIDIDEVERELRKELKMKEILY